MCFKELFPGVFEHEQLLVQHKEVCVMGWRRRSGNLIALRAEEAREERRQTCAAGLALRRPRPCPTHTMSPASGNPPFYSCATRSDMSNDPVPCALCNCVMVVKNVSDEGFFLVCSRLQLSSRFREPPPLPSPPLPPSDRGGLGAS